MNAYLVVPGYQCPVNIQHSTTPVVVPEGTTRVQFSLVSTQAMRDRPQFGAEIQIYWTDGNNRTPIKRSLWKSTPRAEWPQIEIDEGLPISGHAVGSPPGIIPHDVGPFDYVCEQSPAVNDGDRPEGCDRAFLRYTILGGNNGSPVYIAVVLEAFVDGDEGAWIPLEFA
jgi:hypothetical protein